MSGLSFLFGGFLKAQPPSSSVNEEYHSDRCPPIPGCSPCLVPDRLLCPLLTLIQADCPLRETPSFPTAKNAFPIPFFQARIPFFFPLSQTTRLLFEQDCLADSFRHLFFPDSSRDGPLILLLPFLLPCTFTRSRGWLPRHGRVRGSFSLQDCQTCFSLFSLLIGNITLLYDFRAQLFDGKSPYEFKVPHFPSPSWARRLSSPSCAKVSRYNECLKDFPPSHFRCSGQRLPLPPR